MGFKKKKNVLIITVIVICSFILYQLYFFSTLSLSAENSKSHMYESGESIQKSYADKVHVRTEQDKFINEKGAIRGVLLSNMPRYRPATGDTFHCLTTDQSIPYDQVNDDYCDCDDGSDEPSTNACVNGTFYCDTQHKRKPLALVHVPSSVVNDGICDCCDGSDEWIQRTNKYLTQGSVDLVRHLADHCPNIC